MSKRKLQAKGWISFKGLRFALKFATREEIVGEIRRFFEERGVDSFGYLTVEFLRTVSPTVIDDGQKVRILGSCGSHRIRVYVRGHFTRSEFFNTLGHELDHEEWGISGRGFDRSVPYWERKHEVRARLTGLEWELRLG